MKFLNSLVRLIIFVIWALIVYYGFKFLGFEYDPEGDAMMRKFMRVIMVVIIFGGGYFLLRINFFKSRSKK